MEGYIKTLIIKYGHAAPGKPQLSPHKYIPIQYGAKVQHLAPANTSPPLDAAGVKRVQGIAGALNWYGRATDNKLLVSLSAIGFQQASATKATGAAIDQLLDYVATYPNDGITYRASDMLLAAHADAGYLNKSKGRSCAGVHIFLSEDTPTLAFNGPVLTIAEIIKFVMSSAAESKLSALFIAAKRMVPLRQTLIKMGWPQAKSPIQTDNSTAVGVTNKTIAHQEDQVDGYAFLLAPVP